VDTQRNSGEESPVIDEIEFELEEWQNRCDALRVANEKLRDERDDLRDAADSLHEELEATRYALKQANSVISRLRTHIAQGIEL
jgi:chromosome segregation ATPase